MKQWQEIHKKEILPAKVEKQRIPNIYQKLSSKYDLWARLAESKARRHCLELASIKNGEHVIEVAVGTGLAFKEILMINPDGTNTGIDISKDMLEYAQEKAEQTKNKNYRLELGDAYNLEFPDNSFNVLINNYMFDLIPENDFMKVLIEFRRVLQPKGRLVMINMTLPVYWYNRIWEQLYLKNPEKMGGCRGVYMTLYLHEAGFENLKREFLSQMTFPSEVVYGIK